MCKEASFYFIRPQIPALILRDLSLFTPARDHHPIQNYPAQNRPGHNHPGCNHNHPEYILPGLLKAYQTWTGSHPLPKNRAVPELAG